MSGSPTPTPEEIENEPCGSWRVLRYIEGNAAETAWCNRIEGSCPFVGTDQQRDTERRCATEPGTVLRVRWADECINDAYTACYMEAHGSVDAAPPTEQDRQVAIDALRACGAEL